MLTYSLDAYILLILCPYTGAAGMGVWTSGNIIDNRQGWTWAGVAQPFSYFAWAPGEPSGKCT